MRPAPQPLAALVLVLVLGLTPIALAACGDAAGAPQAASGGPPTAAAAGGPTGSPGQGAPSGPAEAGSTEPASRPPASDLVPAAGTAAPAAPAADPGAIAAVRTLIDGARLDDSATLDELAAVRFDDGAPEAAAQALADGVTGDARWAAVWTYSSSGTDPAVLRPVLADPDPTLRAMAAAALTAWGDAAGIPVLAALVGTPGAFAGSYPPASVSDMAAGALARFVVGPDIAADASPAEQAAAWGFWLARHDPSTLVFDADSGTWRLP